jgi:hypothetical protein
VGNGLAYGPATAEIERLVVRLEALDHSDWREMVAQARGVPGRSPSIAKLNRALAVGHLVDEGDRAAARLRATLVSAAFTHVTIDPALDPVPVAEASAVISEVARALVARDHLGADAQAALYAPLEGIVPRSRIASPSPLLPPKGVVTRFVDGLSRLDRRQWRTVEERHLSESLGPSAEENEAVMSAARHEADAAAHGPDGDVEGWLSARADARAAAALSWDRSVSGEVETAQREEILDRAQLAGGALALGRACPEWVVAALCGLFADVVDLPGEVAAIAANRNRPPTDRLFVRGHQELAVPFDVLEQSIDDPRHLWLSALGVRERNGKHDLEVGFGAGPARVARRVSLEIGAAETSTHRTAIPLTWEPVSGARILPGFQGELSVQATDASRSEVYIEGDYRPPLGGVGHVLDERLMHRIAEATMQDLVRRLARALLEI